MSVLPYQFEPRHNSVGEVDGSDDGDDSDNSSEFKEELSMALNKINRSTPQLTHSPFNPPT